MTITQRLRAAGCALLAISVVGAALLAARPASADPVTPAGIDFGEVPIGTSSPDRAITVAIPDGNHLGGAYGSGSAQYAFDNGGCVAGATRSCTSHVRIDANNLGAVTGSWNFDICPDSGDACQPGISVPVRANVVSVLAADPASVDFGNVPVGTTVEREITVTADVGYGVEFSGFDGNPGFTFDDGTCQFGARPCTVKVGYRGTVFGPVATTMTLASCRGADCLPIVIPLRATGSSAFAATPASVDFGDVLVGSTAVRPVDLVLDQGYHLATITLSSFDIQSDNCPDTAPGHCTMQLRATPSAAGALRATASLLECTAGATVCRTIDMPLRADGVAPLVVAAQTLPDGTVGTAYHAQLRASGGKGTLTWTVGAGQLPAGLSLDAHGGIAGTPTAAGTTTLTAHVVDGSSLHQAGDVALTLEVSAAPVKPSGPSSTPPSHPGSPSYPVNPSHPGTPGTPGTPAPPQSPDSPSHGSGDGLAFTGLLTDPARLAGLAALLLFAGVALLGGARWARWGRRG